MRVTLSRREALCGWHISEVQDVSDSDPVGQITETGSGEPSRVKFLPRHATIICCGS